MLNPDRFNDQGVTDEQAESAMIWAACVIGSLLLIAIFFLVC